MALTKPKAAQINFDLTNISDPIIRLNSDKSGANDTDVGFIFERGSSGDNAVVLWDESSDKFVIGTTTATGSASGDITTTPGTINVAGVEVNGTSITTSLDGLTATAAELNILDGATLTTTELNYVDGVTSAIQTQLDAKAPLASPALTGTATAVNLTLSGDLTVNGTTTTVNTTNLVVTDNLIELNNGAASNANDSGIVIERGSTGDNAIIAWDESADSFVMGTTTATGASTGDLTITAGALSIGSLTVSGTVDGRDVATDGTKLDGIESGATADMSASEILTAIKTVDGAGSGLDADTLDGYNSSTSATANTIALRDANADISANVFNGTASSARYADLAENYVADAQYEPGTVLIFGGQHEVTASRQPDSNKIAGVVSTAPGVLMNKDCAGEFVVALAFTGRVPTKVKGTISKGDMMVSSNIEGVAVASDNPAIGTVIGKALENYDSEEVGVIEVVVGRL